MDPEKIKIPVPMSDAQSIYAALGSLKRIAANEGDEEFVQTLDGLMDHLKDYHNTVLTEQRAGQDDLIGVRRRIEVLHRARSLTARPCRKREPNYYVGCTEPKTRNK